MTGFFHEFKKNYKNSIRLKSLVFGAMASAVVLIMSGWSLFQNSDFYVFYDEYKFVRETGGGRVSPTFYLENSKGIVHAVKGRYFDCFYRFDLEKKFDIGFVILGDEKVVVACSQGDVKLNVSDGLLAVNESSAFTRYIAGASLVVFVFSIFGFFLHVVNRRLF